MTIRSLRPLELTEPRLATRTRESDTEPEELREPEPERVPDRTARLDLDPDWTARPALLAASRPIVPALLAPLEDDFDEELPERTMERAAERAAERPTEAAVERAPEERAEDEERDALDREDVARASDFLDVERAALPDLLA